MKDNKLVPYREKFFKKVVDIVRKAFAIGKNTVVPNDIVLEKELFNAKKENEAFINNVLVKEDEEEKRLESLRIQYENGEIEEEDIGEEDLEKLVAKYEKETEELERDTEKRREHIARMLGRMRG